jgi:gliding motility-associated-like protein
MCMKKLTLSTVFLFIVAIVFGQYKEGLVYFKLKSDLSLTRLTFNDEIKFNTIKSTFAVKNVYRTFSHLEDETLSLIYTIEAPVTINENALVEALQSFAIVEYAERVPEISLSFTPNDPLINQQWYLGSTYINAFNAWNMSSGSTAVKLAIVDDEVRVTHEDLQPKIYTNTAEIAGNGIDDDNNGYIDDRNGWDAGDNDNNPNRPLSAPAGSMIHGTHCAGIAAAATNNVKGIASIGYGVSLIPVKVNRDANTGNSLDNPYGGVEYAIAAKSNVVSMSWGGGAYSQTGQLLFDYGHSQGIVFVAAAGNSSSSAPHYPSAYNHVIAVAASTTGDLKSGFSNYGTWVDITAPGSNIYSCIGNADNTYGMLSGTSMACPMVAGLCALMLSNSPSLTPDALESCLKLSADNIDAKNPSYTGQLGAGRINAFNALKCLPCLAKASFNIGSNNQLNYAVNSNIPFTSTGFGNSYQWILNGVVSSTLPSFSQLFNTKGNYTIQLVAIDNVAGCRDTVTKYFTVFDTLPNICLPLRDANWFFGANASVSFTTDPPTVKSGSLNTFEGTTTRSDNCGNLQFYSDGLTIWDKSGGVMFNGSGLLGNSSSTQSAIAIEVPNSNGLYYLFYIDFNGGSSGLHYSIIDLTKPGNGTVLNPLGEVVSKNILLQSGVSEKLAAIRHDNGNNYWVICHKSNTNDYVAIEVGSQGILPAVISNIPGDNFSINATGGQMKFSPCGDKLAIAYWDHPVNNFKVFDFNTQTGIVSGGLGLNVGPSSGSCAYGVEFSLDGTKLYLASICASRLDQYDFITGVKTTIINEVRASGETYGLGALQMAPNGKIYVSRIGYGTLGVIHSPNSAGVACKYCESSTPSCGLPAVSGLNLQNGTKCRLGLPAFFVETKNCKRDFTVVDSCVNYPIQFNTADASNFCKGITTFSWKFGDSLSSSNTSSLQNPSHVYSKTGSYQVELKVASPCDTIIVKKTITIICCGVNDNIRSKTTICLGDSAYLNAPHSGGSYVWSPTTYLSNSTVANPNAYPPITTVYQVTVSNSSGCIYIDTVVVEVAPKTPVTIVEHKSCGIDTLSISPVTNYYLWSTGQINQPTIVNQSGLYWVIARNINGCYDSAQVLVNVSSSALLKIVGDTIGCIGDSVLLKSSIKSPTLLWSNGSNADSIFVKNMGWYKLTYTNGTCTSVDSIFVRFNSSSVVFSIGKDTSYCGAFSKVISTFPSTSLWSTGVTGTQIVVSAPGIYWAEQTNACGYFRDSIHLIQFANPTFSLGQDITICKNSTSTLVSPLLADSLKWSTGNTANNSIAVGAGLYWLELYQNNCHYRDSIQIVQVDTPQLVLSKDTSYCGPFSSVLNTAPNISTWSTGLSGTQIVVSTPGLYWAEQTNACGSFRDSILIAQQAIPIFSLGSDSSICIGDSLSIGTTQTYDSLLWNNGNNSTSQFFVRGGDYWLELYKNGCKFRDTVKVTEVSSPTFKLPSDTLICENERLYLNVPIGLNFVWDNGSKLQSRELTDAGSYWITVLSPCGNYNDTINVITESCECKFAVPTAFSPNRDGVNDLFRVLSTCALSKFRLSVFNRWGEKVFETDDSLFGWNGTYKNEPQPMGTFVWTCSYYDTFEKRQKDRVGNVTLIR